MDNVATINLPQVPFANIDDILVNGNGDAGRITKANFLGAMNDWSTITNKPFENFEQKYFRTTERADGADILTLSDSVITSLNKVSTLETEISTLKDSSHTHSNKTVIDLFNTNDDGKLVWNNIVVGSDYELPIATTSQLGGIKVDGTTITADADGTIHGANTYTLPMATTSVLGGVKPDGVTIAVNENGVITCINDSSIPNWVASTEYNVGALVINGVIIYQCMTEHTSEESFDDTEKANWTALTGEKGDKGDKGQDGTNGTNGKDGASPTIDATTKHWIVGTVDTGVKAEAQSNYFYTGTEFPASDLIDGDLYLSFAEDTRGNVYQYNGSSLAWSLQGNLYGGGAPIDDTSTSGVTVTWSASKLNSTIGNINAILASVTGGVT